ncbi:MAG: DUF58 domain-containing protein [Pirellulales bacterium]
MQGSTQFVDDHFSILDLGVTPWVALFVCILPLLVLLNFGIYPTRRTAYASAVPFVLSLIVPWAPDWYPWIVIGLGGAIALFAIVDLVLFLTMTRIGDVQVSRQMQRVASLGNSHKVEISIDNRSGLLIHLFVREDCMEGLQITPEKHELKLQPKKRSVIEFKIIPSQRGEYLLQYVYGHFQSLVGLWLRTHKFKCESSLNVYPNIKQIGEYALLARTNRLSQIGVRRTRKAGQDNDFERLRDYTQDDNYRHIDWRSTGRRQKLTVRQFQTDQSQRIIFLLDCGRMMTNQYQGLSLLDYALNSILMLSYVALDQGDSVGMLCFSDHIHTYVPVAGGKKQMNRILHGGFNQFPSLVQSRFDQAFLYLSTHCRRRTLVVLLTNVIDQVNSDQIQNYMQNLLGCHLPLLVLLRDHSVFNSADHPTNDPEVLFRSAAASKLLVWRHQVLQRLRAGGTLTLDVFPEDMTARLVNQYLEVKARHML